MRKKLGLDCITTIRNVGYKLRNHENLKIFPKICIQTFSVIAIIVLFIHLFVYLIFPRTYLDVRKEEIYTKANEITENLNGKSEDYIEQALDFYSNTNEIKAFIKRIRHRMKLRSRII